MSTYHRLHLSDVLYAIFWDNYLSNNNNELDIKEIVGKLPLQSLKDRNINFFESFRPLKEDQITFPLSLDRDGKTQYYENYKKFVNELMDVVSKDEKYEDEFKFKKKSSPDLRAFEKRGHNKVEIKEVSNSYSVLFS